MADKPTVLATNALHPDGNALIAPHARLIVAPDTADDTLRELAREADGIIVRAKLPDDIFEHAPRLKGAVRHGVGLDFIPVEAATAKGIAVANLPGCNTRSVAEYVFGALMQLRRPLGVADAVLRGKGWNAARPLSEGFAEIGGSTLGIIGVGTIGKAIASIGDSGFGMRVIGASRSKGRMPAGVEEVELDDLFQKADAIVLSCALTAETKGLVDARRIGLMKRTAVLINVARGPVVVTQALLEALKQGAIAGAALDVHDVQPLAHDNPVFAAPNLLLTPHIAAITATSSRFMSVGSVEEMLLILRGQDPKNLANPGYRAQRGQP